MLEFEYFKILNGNDLSLTSIKFNFIDDELREESIEDLYEKLNEYETYLEYDCKGQFSIEYKKKAIIEMTITFPNRKVPEDKKELEEFTNRYVMDFSEYYYKINNFDDPVNNDMIAPT